MMDQTPRHILQKIDQARQERWTTLDLSATRGTDILGEIPPQVFELDWLESLNLKGNALLEIPQGVTRLRNLKVLDVSDNDLRSLPEEIG